MQKQNPESVGMLELPDKKIVADVAVSVDGTYQVLVYVIKCLVCHECSVHSKWDHKSEKYKSWWDKHRATCYINHSGSSDRMETKGTIDIFWRSIDKNVYDAQYLSVMEFKLLSFSMWGSEKCSHML